MKTLWNVVVGVALIAAPGGRMHAADLVEAAAATGGFETLVTALKAADLVGTLKGPGPFTVFAPTDAAFARLPPGTVESLLKPENRSRLVAVLTYHVVPGTVMAKELVKLKGAATVQGQRLDVSIDGSAVKVDNAEVVKPDLQCDNGVIHVVDSLLLPVDKTIPQIADEAGTFATLLAAVKAADLAETLGSEGPFTLFAPTEEAFRKLPAGTVESLLETGNRQKLVDILKYHVIAGRLYSEDAIRAKAGKSLLGATLTVTHRDGHAYVNMAKLLKTDIDASNGVIHVIDSVLLPPEKTVDARHAIEDAVARGSALYNAGDPAACATLYEHTMGSLMSSTVDSSIKDHMSNVLKVAQHQSCAKTRAWTLRKGMDQMYTQLLRKR